MTEEASMPISFQCPQCGKKLKAPDEAAGKSSKCPGCGGTVTCPEPIYEAEVFDESQPPAGHDPYADLDSDKPYGLVDPQPVAAPSTEDRRPCPMCGEMILTTAAKCRYCGEVFDPALKKAKGSKSKRYGPGEEDLTTGDKVVAVLCSGIGCIAGIVWMIQGKPKGKKMVGLSLAMNVVWIVIRLILEAATQQLRIQGGP
jgi:predicted RNA-binding Zn-ribbon protein involved in translation (DUF1610 family)